MAFLVIGERFNSSLETHEIDSFVLALKDAEELSKVHDMDFVVILNGALPVAKYEDGKLL